AWIHGMDMFLLNDISFVPAYMHDELPEEKLTVDVELSDGQILSAGLINASVIHTPGHTPGSISVRIGDTIFTGDLLFKSAIGRTDLSGGSHETLINSVKEKILVFPDDLKIYPGHGPSSTIGEERTNNPFLVK
ncbi:MAG: MBL fold metallo-hydrolase, partial [Candidatus Aquicultor sp.]